MRRALFILAATACGVPQDSAVQAHAPQGAGPQDAPFVSSARCQSCHPDAYASWQQTYHRTMTQRASPQAILAPWDDVTLSRHGRLTHLFREGDSFYIDMPLPGTTGATSDERIVRPVVMTTGSHHLQLYWIPVPWIDEPTDPNGTESFNQHCASCHAPGPDDLPGGDLRNRGIDRPRLGRILASPGRQHPALSASEQALLTDHVARLQHEDRLMQFAFAWFIREQRWIHEDDSFLAPPEDPAAVAELTEGWSNGCDRCHSVAPDFSWNLTDQLGEASAVDLGIACEACHGAGQAHAARYQSPLSRYAAHLGYAEEDDIVVPSELPADRSAQVCGQCHAELVPHDPDFPDGYQPGDDLLEVAHALQLTDERPDWLVQHLETEPDALESGFWRDGTMRISGRDYTALLETGCHTRGELSCTTCHQMHGADPNDQLKAAAHGETAAGEAVCVDCHAGFDDRAHTHHADASPGARCMNCHMPRTTLGLLTAMRSHRIDSPSATRAQSTGRPDACSLCHLDRPLAWTAQHLTDWYDQAPLPSWAASPTPAAIDWLLRGDAAQRAVVAFHLGHEDSLQAAGDDWTPVFLAHTIDDPYVAVRTIARAQLHGLPGYSHIDWAPSGPPDSLAAAQEAVLQQWAVQHPTLDRPELWIHAGKPDRKRIEKWRLMRDETPVSVNE